MHTNRFNNFDELVFFIFGCSCKFPKKTTLVHGVHKSTEQRNACNLSVVVIEIVVIADTVYGNSIGVNMLSHTDYTIF